MNPEKTYRPKSLAWLLGLALLPMMACTSSSPPVDYDAMFLEAEQLMLDAKWREAHTMLRVFLKDNPDHPGAHFYLGRSYLYLEEDFRPTIAEGELQTALALYYENGKHSYIDRFGNKHYFEMICNIASAKVSLKEYAFLVKYDVPDEKLRSVVKKARHYVTEAQKIGPKSNDVITYDQYVTELEELTFTEEFLDDARGRSYFNNPHE